MGVPAHINVTEVRKPELDAQLVAESIAQQLERRIMFRRAMKRAVGNSMRLGALGIKVWIYKGEIFDFAQVGQEKQDDTPRGDRPDRSDRPRAPRRDREARE
jgi:small subunit ribosomal protein S3